MPKKPMQKQNWKKKMKNTAAFKAEVFVAEEVQPVKHAMLMAVMPAENIINFLRPKRSTVKLQTIEPRISTAWREAERILAVVGV